MFCFSFDEQIITIIIYSFSLFVSQNVFLLDIYCTQNNIYCLILWIMGIHSCLTFYCINTFMDKIQLMPQDALHFDPSVSLSLKTIENEIYPTNWAVAGCPSCFWSKFQFDLIGFAEHLSIDFSIAK